MVSYLYCLKILLGQAENSPLSYWARSGPLSEKTEPNWLEHHKCALRARDAGLLARAARTAMESGASASAAAATSTVAKRGRPRQCSAYERSKTSEEAGSEINSCHLSQYMVFGTSINANITRSTKLGLLSDVQLDS